MARAVQLALVSEHVLSYDSAAYAWGVPLLSPRVPLVHVTRPGVQGARIEHGVKHHLERRGLDGVYDVDGLRATGLERTALDIAREYGRPAGVVALDGALRLGAQMHVVEAVLAGMWSWPRVRQARRAAMLTCLGAESPGETLVRVMALELGLGDPVLQFPLEVRNGVAWCDVFIGRHVFEFDGRDKYVPTSRGGYAERPPEDVVWSEKLREGDVAAHGLGVSRLYWRDCVGRGRDAGLERMAREYAATCRRLGTTLPVDVAAFADRMADHRDRRLRGAFVTPNPVPMQSVLNPWRRAG